MEQARTPDRRGVRWLVGRLAGTGGLFRNALTLISGTIATQALVFAFSPVLSRIFAASDFGHLANYNAWVAVLALLSNLRYEQAVIVAKGRQHTNRVVVLTTLLSLVSCLVYAAVAIGIYTLYRGGGYLADLKHVVLFIPLGVLVISVSSLFIQYNLKTGQFRLLAAVAAVQVVFTVGPQIVLGLLRVPHALIIGTILGFVFAALVYARHFFQGHTLGELWEEIDPRQLIATAAMHVNFPRFMLGADAITVGVQQFVPVFVLALFNPAIAGLYAFSARVVRVPTFVVSTAIGGALRKEAIDHVHAGESLTALFTGTVRTLFLLSIVPFAVVLIAGPQLFAFVFGHQWADAGRIVQILVPGIVAEFVAMPLAAFFLVTETQRYTFIVQALGFVLMVSALAIGRHVLHDFIRTCYLVSGVMLAVNLLTIVFAARVAGFRARAVAAVAP